MAKTAAWHSEMEEGTPDGVYHDDTECTAGSNIEPQYVVPGTGALKHCEECAGIFGA